MAAGIFCFQGAGQQGGASAALTLTTAQVKAQMQAQQAQAQMQQTGSNSYVVKIGDEKQEKSGLKPPPSSQPSQPSPTPLSEEELIKLFNAESTSKKQKKTKKAK